MKKSKSPPRICKVLLIGSTGRMGQELISALHSRKSLTLSHEVNSKYISSKQGQSTRQVSNTLENLTDALQKVDFILDFSTTRSLDFLIKGLSKVSNKTVLIGTTGIGSAQVKKLVAVAKKKSHKILIAGNTSLGILTLCKLVANATKVFHPLNYDISINETHHRKKIDAPSGTAILIAQSIQAVARNLTIDFQPSGLRKNNSISIHSVRGGSVVGEHEVRFIGEHEEISINHTVHDRSLFAQGAIQLIQEIDQTIKAGLALSLLNYIPIEN